MQSSQFMCGVVEGFYGRPWNARQRHQLFTWLRQWGLNTYLYAPKDDLKHRVRWRELYDESQASELAALIRDCQRNELNFIYALAPGLDLRYADVEDREVLHNKFRQLASLGSRHFALLFDDIPDRMAESDANIFGSFAEAQCQVANELFRFIHGEIPDARVLFCPTPYCGRMAKPSIRESKYLREVGQRLMPEIDILWTGPEIISETISVESIRELQTVIQRKPVIWDNLHANDYDLRRIYLGPYAGRPLELRAEVRGILSNPNCQFEANFIPLRTLARYIQADSAWTPREAFLDAAAEWLPAFSSNGEEPITRADVELLGDLFYLPFESGDRIQRFLQDFQRLLTTPPAHWNKTFDDFARICREIICLYEKIIGIDNRELLFTLNPCLWEIKEEAAFLMAYVEWLRRGPTPGEKFSAPEFRPQVYRGGLVARLQRMVPMDEQGRFSTAENVSG